MIVYIPTSSAAIAQSLSTALWQLSQPPRAQAGRATKDLFLCLQTKDGSSWLVVDTELSVTIHPEAELGEIVTVLEPWIFEELLPANTLSELAKLVNSSKGSMLNLWSAFPELFKAQARTKEQLIAANLYPGL